jgi:protein ImuB
VARYGKDCIVPVGETLDTIAPLPLAALRLFPDTLEALSQLGLKRITDVLDRPRAPLAARFGAEFVRRLDQALGRDDEPIAPRLAVPAAIAEQRFADPIALEADVLGTIEKLAEKLGALIERRGEGARLLQAALFRTDGRVFRIEVGTSEPLRDPARIRHLFADRLGVIGDELDPGFGFDMLRLAALVTERHEPAQIGLAAPDHTQDLAHLIDRLGARFGLRRVTRLVPHDTHIPEFAVMAVGAAAVGGSAFSAHSRASGNPVLGSGSPLSRGRAELQQDSAAPTRPIRLFARPEPIEALAEVPDGPPVQFTWRRMRHVVAHAEGPERIAMEWWRDAAGVALTRDYFRVESREGVRVWLYREGLVRGGEQTRWFLHGVFA